MALLGLIVVVLGVLGVQSWRDQIEQRNIKSAELSASVISSLIVSRNITADNLNEGTISAESKADMDADVAELVRQGSLVGLEVWAGDGKHLLYADKDFSPAGDSGVEPDELDRVRRGGAFVEDGTRERTTANLEITLPYTPPDGDGSLRGVVEVLLPRDPIDGAINSSTRQLYLGAGVIALLIAAAIILAARHHRFQNHAIRHDRLTGLGNRVGLAEAADRVLRTAGPQRMAAMLLLDLDGFKEVNDTLGHDAGDELLVAVAQRLSVAAGSAVVVVRLGGDEFAVLIDNLGTTEEGIAVATKVRAAIRQQTTIAGLAIEIDASVGIAFGPMHGTDTPTLLKCADVAMYDAKRAGSGVQVYDPQTDPREAQQLTMLGELRKGIAENQLRLHYQPKCRADGTIEEVEALVRWQHPERGLLPPSAFVPLAERTALVRPLTIWVLNEAARQCAEWWKAGRKLRVAVNVCPRNLVNDDLVAIVRAAAAPYNLPLRALRLEITETAVIGDEERAIEVLQQLRELGVEVSIDDFGAGYTSLSYLPTLPVEALKIDKQFIDNMMRDELDEAVVRNVIQLAHDLGMTSVAEGVETFEVWDRLNDLGCDEIQGYILTKPLPPDKVPEWLDHWRDTPAASRKPAVAHSAP